MHVMMFRATVKPEHVPDVKGALQTMFAAIHAHQPQGVRYASSQLEDTPTFVILLALEQPGENPLAAIPEFCAFQGQIQGWLAEPTVPQPLTVVGSYNLF